MIGLRLESVRYLSLVGAALVTACGSPGYNNNPSQQNTGDRVGCLASSDYFAVYFHVHLQPADLNEDAGVTRELFQPYCSELPKPGNLFFTADLVGNDLKRTPIAVRIIEQEFVGGDPGHSDSYEDRLTLAEFPYQTYPKGFIESRFALDERGHYAIELIRAAEDGASEKDSLRIPLNVGVEVGATSVMMEVVTKLSITAGTILFCFLVFRLLRSRKLI